MFFHNCIENAPGAFFGAYNTSVYMTRMAFVDGSKPMSEWDSYISDIYSFGYGRIQELYQQAYDRFVSGQ